MEELQTRAAQAATTQRVMMAVVIILGVLIVVGLGGLVAAMVTGAGRAPQLAEPYTTRLPAPAGAEITAAQIEGNRLIVHIEGGGGSVVVLDPATGRILGRVELEPQ